MALTDMERFMAQIDNSGSCWEWTGTRHRQGYGWFGMGGKKIMAHRAAYTLFVGPIPKGLLVCHRCDNPSCANPEHLFLGTYRDNNRDCVAKGRHIAPSGPCPEKGLPGESNPNAKFTAGSVREMRQLFAEGSRIADIARRFSVSWSGAEHAIKGRSWKHLEDDHAKI